MHLVTEECKGGRASKRSTDEMLRMRCWGWEKEDQQREQERWRKASLPHQSWRLNWVYYWWDAVLRIFSSTVTGLKNAKFTLPNLPAYPHSSIITDGNSSYLHRSSSSSSTAKLTATSHVSWPLLIAQRASGLLSPLYHSLFLPSLSIHASTLIIQLYSIRTIRARRLSGR